MTNGIVVKQDKNTIQYTTEEGSLQVELSASPARLSIFEYTFTTNPVDGDVITLTTIPHKLGYIPYCTFYAYAVDVATIVTPRVNAGTYSQDPLYLGTAINGTPNFYSVVDKNNYKLMFNISGFPGDGATPPNMSGSKWRFKIYIFSNTGLDT